MLVHSTLPVFIPIILIPSIVTLPIAATIIGYSSRVASHWFGKITLISKVVYNSPGIL